MNNNNTLLKIATLGHTNIGRSLQNISKGGQLQ